VVLSAREWQLHDEPFDDVVVIRAPLDDFDERPIPRGDLAGALKAARQTAKAIEGGTKCLVTCAAGMNRSGLISALTLHLRYGWPGERCIQAVQEGRTPSAKDGYEALSNERFKEALRRLR
jgi:protein-tyrosine phosphatase